MVYHGDRRSNYGTGTFTDLGDEVLRAIRTFERSGIGTKIVLCCTGISGMSLAFPLALSLGCDVAVLRKPNEESHGDAGKFVGVPLRGKTCVFVDDFVSGGLTRARVERAIKAERGKLAWQYTAREDALVPVAS